MMQYRKTWLILLMVALMALWGCSDDDDPTEPVDNFDAIAAAALEYMSDNTDCPGVLPAATLEAELANWSVIDIRGADDYNAGHIPGAVNATLSNLLDVVDAQGWAADEPIVIACYTGQSAGHAKVALELMGYENTKSLLFGMSSWNSQLDKWTSNCQNNLSAPEIVNAGVPTEVGFPVLEGTVGGLVQSTLEAGFKGKSYSDISGNLENYFIINYFGLSDYMPGGDNGVPGHIPGAYQFSPYTSIEVDALLNTLPTDGTEIIVYCWTGQHSSQVTFFLNMLGYDAYSLKFGSNNLFYDQLTGHQWDSVTSTNDFALESGFMPSATFQTIAESLADYVNDGDDCPGVMDAATLEAELDSWQVVDVRSETDYNLGHIPGAIHSSVGGILTDVSAEGWPVDEPIVVACYTGQSAGHAKIALELMGYENVKSLKWGMAGWDASLAFKWDDKIDDALGNIDVVNNNGELVWGDFPTIADGTTVGERVEAMLDAGFQAISFADIEDNLENYFIVNYFGLSDYMPNGANGVPGHIPGAYQFTPYASLGWDEMLGYLPADGTTIVVYCWTGQHSSQVTAYLNMLGYNAKSLAFGSNQLFHTSLTGHKWGGNTTNRTLEPTPTM